MRRITLRPDFGNRPFITLGFTACWHDGNQSCQRDAIIAMLHSFRRRKLPWWHLGDAIEAIAPYDKRFCCESHKKTIMAQASDAASLLRVAKDTLVGLHVGNHEDKLSRIMGDMTMDMLERAYILEDEAKRRWIGGVAITKVVCPGGSCDVVTAHSDISLGGGTSDPDHDAERKRTKLRRYLSAFAGQLKVIAHAHQAVIAPPVTSTAVGFNGAGKFAVRPEWCAACPSMFETYNAGDSMAYPEYAERAMYGAAGIGWIEADIFRDGAVKGVRYVAA